MPKQRIHWFQWDCPSFNPGDNYTNAPGLVNCSRCERKMKAAQHHIQPDGATPHTGARFNELLRLAGVDVPKPTPRR
jgi:hypothetical protein